MLGTIRRVYESYGFEPLETPAIEYTDALGKFLPDQDRPNEGVFSLQGRGRAVAVAALRPDRAARPLRGARTTRRCRSPSAATRSGTVWRNEKPGPGRFRQFMQFDADTVGADSVAADAEMCMLAADTLEALGIKRGEYVIKVNSRKVLDGLREVVGLSGPENDAKWLTAMRALDKVDRLGGDEVSKLLGKGRKDDSGDFTPGQISIRVRSIASLPSPDGTSRGRASQAPLEVPLSLWQTFARRSKAPRSALKVSMSWSKSPN